MPTMITTAELDTQDWQRLLEIAGLTHTQQDRRILDELRRAAADSMEPKPRTPLDNVTGQGLH